MHKVAGSNPARNNLFLQFVNIELDVAIGMAESVQDARVPAQGPMV